VSETYAPPVQEPIQEPAFEDPGYEDTYSFGGTQVYTLRDGKQTITFKIMNEGDKAHYQRLTNRDIKVDRKTDQAVFRPDQASDRHALILTAVVDWNLYTRDKSAANGWTRLSFNQSMLQNWLKVTNPAIVEDLEKAIRKANPWLNIEDATEEDLEEQIAELQDELQNLRARTAGKTR
jgi:hypothetical protein